MICEKCGASIDWLEINEFNYDGRDSWYKVPAEKADEDAVVVETNLNWTGYELSEEEQLECVRCPKCKRFPFDYKEIQVYEIVRLVMFRRPENDS